jgi:primosomal protein DnaI
MIKLNETRIFDKTIDNNLKQEYLRALKDERFKKYVSKLLMSHDNLMKYTSRLETCVTENSNCLDCLGLTHCKNEINGFKLTPNVNGEQLKFNYVACKYKEKELKDNEKNKNVYLFDIPKEIRNAEMKNIYIDDKRRKDVIIWLQRFVKGYDENKPSKGLYLHGNFGCGKTYLIAAAFNELSKKGIKSAIIYWPEFLRDLKASFDNDFKDKFDDIKLVPLLLIDDIGAENSTPWARDEILGPILQYRMESHLTTFFTSNLGLDELEAHLSMTKGKVDLLKAKRIIERVNKLTENIEMNAENLRK